MSEKQIVRKRDKIVNYYCICKKKYFINDKISFVLPCSHMFHSCCIQNKTNCLICNEKIKKLLDEDKIFSNKKYKLYQNDILSVKITNPGSINYLILPTRLMNFLVYINTLMLSEKFDDIFYGCEILFKNIGLKINFVDNTTNKNTFYIKDGQFRWTDKYKNSKKIIISNHSSFLDTFIQFYIFKCGFIASEFLLKTSLGRLIVHVGNVLVFKRGVDTNVVEKIKEYLKKHNQIAIFPEGMMKDNNETLFKFRTGSFYAGADICPVIIKYRNYFHDDNLVQALFKILTQDEIIVDVYIEDIEHPPFNNERIENIRKRMAKTGEFKLSRVSNRDIKSQ